MRRKRYIGLRGRDRTYVVETSLAQAMKFIGKRGDAWVFELTYREHRNADGTELLPVSRCVFRRERGR